jgi:hypothetical protein
VSVPPGPAIDPRRSADFTIELLERARAWIRDWALGETSNDFGVALLKVAAHYSSEIAKRLDRAGEKMSLGFLDWLAIRGAAAHPARMPVAFKLATTAKDPVLAVAPVQLQADAGGASVVFETETDVRLVPGRLDALVAVDPDNDAFYLPPSGLPSLDPLDPMPKQWQLKALASVNATTLQLDPALGLAPDMIVSIQGEQYRIVTANGGLVTIDPSVSPAAGFPQGTAVTKVSAFLPFDTGVRNAQKHALYIGDDTLVNVEAAASIEIVGAVGLPAGIVWTYSGKGDSWQPLKAAATQDGLGLLLTKDKGSVEQTSLGSGQKSRWIRGLLAAPSSAAVSLSSLALTINPDADLKTCPASNGVNDPGAQAEGFANSTALDFNGVFYPLGSQPRQFDTFYLGCAEAFSKNNADVAICFELSDLTTSSFSPVRSGTFANRVLASVAKDHALHLVAVDGTTGALTKFLNRDALQPPAPADAGKSAAGPSVPLDQAPAWRLPVWGIPNSDDFWIATSASTSIWVWHENAAVSNGTQSGWVSFGTLPVAAWANVSVQGLAYVGGANPTLFALYSGQLFSYDVSNPSAQWINVPTASAAGPITLTTIVSVLDTDDTLTQSITSGLVGVATDNLLYAQDQTGNWAPLSLLATPVNATIFPAALVHATNLYVFAVTGAAAPQSLLAIEVRPANVVTEIPKPLAHAGDMVLGSSLDAIADGTRVIAVAAVSGSAGSYVVTWAPFEASPSNALFEAVVPAGTGPLGGAATALDKFVVVPGTHGNALVAAWDLTLRLALAAKVGAGIVVPTSLAAPAPNDVVAVDDGASTPTAAISAAIAGQGTTFGTNVFYPLDPAKPTFGVGSGGLPLVVFRTSTSTNALNGIQRAPTTTSSELTLAPGDHSWTKGSLLVFATTGPPALYRINNLNTAQDPWIATLVPAPPVVAGATPAVYWHPEPTGGRVAPSLSLNAANRQWDAALLDHATLNFDPSFTPDAQTGKAVSVDGAGHPILIALDRPWTAAPAAPAVPTPFALDAAVGTWTAQMGDNSANPQLAWEYWNGASWWKLAIGFDETLNFKTTGRVRFTVPPDLAQTQVSGRNNYWIRARLVGGDYGQEQVSVITQTLPNGQTVQTIQRSTDGIRPPAIIALRVRYVTAAATPQYVIAQDNGSFIDQSDANRAGANAEAFVPLKTLMARLTDGPAGAAQPAADACIPDCQCDGSPSTSPAPAPVASAAASAAASPDAAPPTGRAIFLGLTSNLIGAPINILLMADQERAFDGFAPLAVDALIGDRFAPLVLHDTTRALGETGLLSLSFSVQPQPRELFGKSLAWLRLRPSRIDPNAQWAPAIGGAYLNAVWATAAETLTREPVGSSDGRPNLTLTLARPPVLDGTLELRVHEPLDDEDRTALLNQDPESVRSDVPNLPGDWVLWRQVPDPADNGPGDRVYALDETPGTIVFGDGLHGMIPPIGRDVIVAFTYKRTAPAPDGSDRVPANDVAARATLSLVTPVQGVEAAYSADHAAGGAPAESGDRVLRFANANLRHHDRALTAQDFEDIALASSSGIAQARCFVGAGKVRVVVVMRGAEPRPAAAARRELYRALTDKAPVALTKPGALTIAAPRIRHLRIDLKLEVPSLDNAGEVGDAVKGALVQLFDPATGGSGNGWELSAAPGEDDIALALINIPNLQSIESISFYEIAADASDTPWSGNVRRDDLVMLADDPVRLVFAALEAAA